MAGINVNSRRVVFGLVAAVALSALSPGASFSQQAAAPPPAACVPNLLAPCKAPLDPADNAGWTSMFDGRTLNQWTGDTRIWRVQDNAIYAENTCEKPIPGTVYIDWNGEAADFDLKLKTKLVGRGNGGVQYRGWLKDAPGKPAFVAWGGGAAGAAMAAAAAAAPPAPPRPAPAPVTTPAAAPAAAAAPRPCPSGQPRGTSVPAADEDRYYIQGAQFDYNDSGSYGGQFYEQNTGRNVIASPGEIAVVGPTGSPVLVSRFADSATTTSWWKPNDWNDILIIARGHSYQHYLNGHLTAMVTDNSPLWQASGMIGFEIEGQMQLWMKDLYIRKYS